MRWTARRIALVALALLVAAGTFLAIRPSGNGWLTGVWTDAERFRRLQTYLGGFDQPMWEIGQRYVSLHQALLDQNHELAAYHWEKIGEALEGGLLKRPRRAANAREIFLGPAYQEVAAGLASGDPERAWAAFAAARESCMRCHEAEAVAFINNQPMFTNRRERAALP